MTALIWVIQIVHYPSFQFVSTDNFIEFEKFHVSRITYIVAPMMILEILTAMVLLKDLNFLFILNFILLVLIWASTFFLSVPLHEKLLKHHSYKDIKKLIYTNWPRTILWSTRSILLILIWLQIL